MKKVLLICLLFLSLMMMLNPLLCYGKEEKDLSQENSPRKGAEAPEKVYMRYVNAVHKGDIKTIKKLLYSSSLILWKKNGRKMLAITRKIVPMNPQLVSKRQEKQFQYNYTILNMRGVSPRGNSSVGEIKLIVENGDWKIYTEIWKSLP